MPEKLREPGPGVDRDQDFRQLHPWQAFGNEVVQLNDLVGQLLHRSGREHDPTLLQAEGLRLGDLGLTEMLDDCLRRVGECFEVLSGFLLETEDPEKVP